MTAVMPATMAASITVAQKDGLPHNTAIADVQ